MNFADFSCVIFWPKMPPHDILLKVQFQGDLPTYLPGKYIRLRLPNLVWAPIPYTASLIA